MAQGNPPTGDQARDVSRERRANAVLRLIIDQPDGARTRLKIIGHEVLEDWPLEWRHDAIDDLAATGRIELTDPGNGNHVLEPTEASD